MGGFTGEEVERNKLNSPQCDCWFIGLQPATGACGVCRRKRPSDWFIVADLLRYWSTDWLWGTLLCWGRNLRGTYQLQDQLNGGTRRMWQMLPNNTTHSLLIDIYGMQKFRCRNGFKKTFEQLCIWLKMVIEYLELSNWPLLNQIGIKD